MRKLLKPFLNCLIGIIGPVLVYGGIHGIIALWRLGGLSNRVGAATVLIGSLFIITLFFILMHDTVWPTVKAWIRDRANKKTPPPSHP